MVPVREVRCKNPAEPRMGSMGAVAVDTIQQKHVEVDIEVEGTPEALDPKADGIPVLMS